MFTNQKASIMVLFIILPFVLNAQKDVTQFLGIPVDGYKSEMIDKLKSKGFTINAINNEVLDGEFNGTKVKLLIGTVNNKVFRIMLVDVFSKSEADIKIRFNNLLQQFQNNKKYLSLPDSTLFKYTISEDEDISSGLSVKNKKYQAYFYQKTAEYDKLNIAKEKLLEIKNLSDAEMKDLLALVPRIPIELNNCFKKIVWFEINQKYGEYYISMFYDNEYNIANGDDL